MGKSCPGRIAGRGSFYAGSQSGGSRRRISSRQRGGDIQPAAGHGVQEPEDGRSAAPRTLGNEGGVLGAVEPVPGQRVAHSGEVEPQLVGAARLGQQPQQRQLPRQQGLVEGSGGKAHRVHGAAEQRAGVPADGQINDTGEGLRRSQTDAPVLPEEGIGVQRLHAQAVDIAGLGHGHDARWCHGPDG